MGGIRILYLRRPKPSPLKTLALLSLVILTISCQPEFGKTVTDKGNKLYYVDPVTEAEAKTVLNWLHEVNHNFGEPPVPFQLSKSGNKYVFKYPVQIEGAENNEGNIGFIETFATKLAERLGAPVDVYLMDEELTTTKKIISGGK